MSSPAHVFLSGTLSPSEGGRCCCDCWCCSAGSPGPGGIKLAAITTVNRLTAGAAQDSIVNPTTSTRAHHHMPRNVKSGTVKLHINLDGQRSEATHQDAAQMVC